MIQKVRRKSWEHKQKIVQRIPRQKEIPMIQKVRRKSGEYNQKIFGGFLDRTGSQ
jgi:hypothetical protein